MSLNKTKRNGSGFSSEKVDPNKGSDSVNPKLNELGQSSGIRTKWIHLVFMLDKKNSLKINSQKKKKSRQKLCAFNAQSNKSM